MRKLSETKVKFKFSKASKNRMRGVNDLLVSVLNRAIEISKVDFGIPSTGGVRTESEQHKLFCDGKSKADGRYKKSKHQLGEAIDVFAYVGGKATWDLLYMAQVACAILQAASELGVSVQWGGHWSSFIDTPHFEIKKKKE